MGKQWDSVDKSGEIMWQRHWSDVNEQIIPQKPDFRLVFVHMIYPDSTRNPCLVGGSSAWPNQTKPTLLEYDDLWKSPLIWKIDRYGGSSLNTMKH